METTNRQTSKITPEMIDQYRRWAGFFSVAVASTVGFRVGYQHGFHTYYNAYIDALFENVHYVGNPADCPECDEETYEWFDVEPPLDNYLPKEETMIPSVKQEGGDNMGP